MRITNYSNVTHWKNVASGTKPRLWLQFKAFVVCRIFGKMFTAVMVNIFWGLVEQTSKPFQYMGEPGAPD